MSEHLTCDACGEQIETCEATVREVASWLFLDCHLCRRQSDVTFRLLIPVAA
jgi:hypothetical protein